MKQLFSLLLGIIFAASSFGASLVPISAPPQASITAAGNSFSPQFSADGRYLFFASHAKNLTTNQSSSLNLNIFRKSLLTGAIDLISADSTDAYSGDNDSVSFSVSSNAQFVAFASAAQTLVPNDSNSAADIFLRDAVSGSTRLVTISVIDGGSPPNPNPHSARPLSSDAEISPDGRWIVFESYSTNLVNLSKDPKGADVFLYDRNNNTITLVSISTNGTSTSFSDSHSAHLSGNARFISFVSSARDLVTDGTPRGEQLFRRDIEQNVTIWASRDLSGYLGPFTNYNFRSYGLGDYVMSEDGQVVAYKVTHEATPMVWVFRYDFQSDSTLLVTSNSYDRSSPQLSADGRFLAYENGTNLMVWDDLLQSNLVVSVNAAKTSPANGVSHTPTISKDGRYIAFVSNAGDLVTNTPNGKFQVYWRDLATGTTKLISRNTNGVASNSDHEFIIPALSRDGLRLAFESRATDLVVDDLNEASDVFVYNLSDDSIAVLSVSQSLRPAATGISAGGSHRNALSADGRIIAFSTAGDVLVRDLATGTTQAAVSHGTNLLLDAEISADGRYVTYTRRRSPYSSVDFRDDILRRDLSQGTDELLTQAPDGPSGGVPAAHLTSSNDQFVVMQTVLSFDSQDRNNVYDIYVHDFASNTNILVSYGANGSSIGGISPYLSADDRKIFFLSSTSIYLKFVTDASVPRLVSHTPNGIAPINAISKSVAVSGNSEVAVFGVMTNLGDRTSTALFKYQIASDDVSFICAPCQNGALDNTGALLAYEAMAADGKRSVYVRDLETGQTNELSVAVDLGFASGTPLDSWSPIMSADARFVLFLNRDASSATNVTKIYARDRVMNQTLLLTPNAGGIGLLSRDGAQLGLSRNGRTAIFRSFAGDLVTGDYNDKRDVFVVHLGSGDSDGDGMDDDWEAAYFGDLSRDGSGDFDGDGQNDLQEFRAGTDPTNRDSVLRAITVTRVGGGTSVFWNAVAGRTYRVESKEKLDDSTWTAVSGQVRITGSTGWIDDSTASPAPQRFYRVVGVR